MHDSLYAQAKHFLLGHTYKVEERNQFYELCKTRAGMLDIAWCGRADCEAHVKNATGATTRNTRDLEVADSRCVACGEPATRNAYFAQSY
ncbi:MAG: hypothetical protein M3R35_02085 [Candidatus Eremiobacteraeota bacterium]|nr:hypothetical protein [Candidatus Eremiobacteraeota bacterium]